MEDVPAPLSPPVQCLDILRSNTDARSTSFSLEVPMQRPDTVHSCQASCESSQEPTQDQLTALTGLSPLPQQEFRPLFSDEEPVNMLNNLTGPSPPAAASENLDTGMIQEDTNTIIVQPRCELPWQRCCHRPAYASDAK